MINFEERQFLEKNKAYTIPTVSGQEVEIDGETFYKISNVDAMRPFFMSLVSNSNHWLFISSTGGLTAGRKDSSNALFPYYTDDKIIHSSENTGSKTIFWVTNPNLPISGNLFPFAKKDTTKPREIFIKTH